MSESPRERLAWLMWCYQQGYTNAEDRVGMTNWLLDDLAALHPDDAKLRPHLLAMADEVLRLFGGGESMIMSARCALAADIISDLPQIIRSVRGARSIRAVAAKAGVTKSTFSNIENLPRPSLDNIVALLRWVARNDGTPPEPPCEECGGTGKRSAHIDGEVAP